jgi:hypothetical protein
MDRTAGWYKRYTQLCLLGIGIVIAVAFNVDTIGIVRQLQNDPVLRGQIINQASDFTKAHPDLGKQLEDTQTKLAQLSKPVTKADSDLRNNLENRLAETKKAKELSDGLYQQATGLVNTDLQHVNSTLGLGWPKKTLCENIHTIDGTRFLGWLLTALALSMGAPFWFDLLNKLMQLRGSKAPDDDAKAKKADTAQAKVGRVG